jgi:hypothetical protein
VPYDHIAKVALVEITGLVTTDLTLALLILAVLFDGQIGKRPELSIGDVLELMNTICSRLLSLISPSGHYSEAI